MERQFPAFSPDKLLKCDCPVYPLLSNWFPFVHRTMPRVGHPKPKPKVPTSFDRKNAKAVEHNRPLQGAIGYDADWFRESLKNKGIRPCIPGRKSRDKPIKYDKRRYRRRKRIDIMFGRLKDWRRVATRYDRCPKVFLSAVALAATVMFRL